MFSIFNLKKFSVESKKTTETYKIEFYSFFFSNVCLAVFVSIEF